MLKELSLMTKLHPSFIFGSGGELAGRDTFHCRELEILEHKNGVLNPVKITKKLLPNHFTHNDITTLLAEVSFK